MKSRKQKKTQQARAAEGGQGLVEYTILLMLVALAAILALTSLGDEIVKALQRLNWGGEAAATDSLILTVVDAAGSGIGGVRVFAYSEQGDYLEIFGDTGDDGEVAFELDNGRYQFMAQHQQHYFWSDVVNRPAQNTAEIQTGQSPFQVTVLDMAGNGVAEALIYVYAEDGTYMGVEGQTDENGVLVIDLVDADVKFRVDAAGKTQWSDVVPTSQDEITIVLNPCSTNQFLAEYFANRDLSGEPVVTRCEESINYDWAGGSPGEGVPTNNFSVRWTGQVQFSEGAVAIRTSADDGVRVWLDDNLITDAWKLQSETTYASRQTVTAGNHTIKMEYFEAYGNAVARLRWEEVIGSCPTGQFLAEYYNNQTLSGDPAVVRCETAVNYDWGRSNPVEGIKSDSFSVRWSGTVNFAAGNYAIRTTTDDGVRLWFDGQLVVDAWQLQTEQSYAHRAAVSGGEHSIKMEYYEQSDYAVAKLNWDETILSCPTGQFLTEYFSNRDLNGAPVLTRCESGINYNWSVGSPIDGLAADDFSIRWSGRFTFAGGETTFTTTTDDGVQLFVDDALLIGAWQPQSSVTHQAALDLSPGEHTVTVNYYEAGGYAVARVSWE